MRFLTSLAALVLVAGVLVTVLPSPAAPPAPPAAHTVLVSAPGGRAVGGGSAAPDFFGSWWKVFKKIMGAFMDFIDAIIDATMPGDGNGNGDGGGTGEGNGGNAALIGPGGVPSAPGGVLLS